MSRSLGLVVFMAVLSSAAAQVDSCTAAVGLDMLSGGAATNADCQACITQLGECPTDSGMLYAKAGLYDCQSGGANGLCQLVPTGIIAVVVVPTVLFIAATVFCCCYFCSCCPMAKRRLARAQVATTPVVIMQQHPGTVMVPMPAAAEGSKQPY